MADGAKLAGIRDLLRSEGVLLGVQRAMYYVTDVNVALGVHRTQDHSGGSRGFERHVGRRGTADAKKEPMADFATVLSRILDRPVIDKTGLDGAFDFILDYSRDDGRPVHPSDLTNEAPSIFTAPSFILRIASPLDAANPALTSSGASLCEPGPMANSGISSGTPPWVVFTNSASAASADGAS